jgi:ribosomal protein S18 acetylase RimI-like enzyme
MRRIVGVAGVRAGRIVIDWGADHISHGVDIAVLPELRSTGVGLHMLRAWLEVADHGAWTCTLDVNSNNRAALLYRRLGFREVVQGAGPEAGPFIRMARAPVS